MLKIGLIFFNLKMKETKFFEIKSGTKFQIYQELKDLKYILIKIK